MAFHRTRLPRATSHSGRSDVRPAQDPPEAPADKLPALDVAVAGQLVTIIQELAALDVHGLLRVGGSAALHHDFTFE